MVYQYNKLDQQVFTVQVEAGSADTFSTFVDEAAVYFILQELGGTNTPSVVTPSFTPSAVTPSVTPAVITPSFTPSVITPSITPTAVTPSVTSTAITPSATSRVITPSSTSTAATPSRTPTIVTPSPTPSISTPPSLAEILVASMLDVTGRSREELREMSKTSILGKTNPTAREVLLKATGNTSLAIRIRKRTINQAVAAYQAAGLDSSRVPEAVDALLNQSLATVYAEADNGMPIALVAPTQAPPVSLFAGSGALSGLLEGRWALAYPTPEAFEQDYQALMASRLASDPEFLVVTMDWATAPEEMDEDQYFVLYSFDPSVSNNGTVNYREKCGTTLRLRGNSGIRGQHDGHIDERPSDDRKWHSQRWTVWFIQSGSIQRYLSLQSQLRCLCPGRISGWKIHNLGWVETRGRLWQVTFTNQKGLKRKQN